MNVRLRIKKKGTLLYEGVHKIVDQDSFAAAFAEVWERVRQKRMEATTSVGELMDIINDEVIEELHGAEISLEKTGTEKRP
jgi:hypothetical protein